MNLLVEARQCTGCGACAEVCPKDAITMERDKEGHYYPTVSSIYCVQCQKCHQACPVLHKQEVKNTIPAEAYVFKNTDETTLLQSASGGVFSALASSIISDGGVVFGAVWDEDKKVRIKKAETLSDISPMRGSKYVYSHANGSYRDALNLLKQGKTVLFTGLPCQISALYSVTGVDFDNLYTAEIPCHGSGSELVFEKYIASLENRYNKKIKTICQSSKKKEWDQLIRKVVEYHWEDGTSTCVDYTEDSYLSLYMMNVHLRKSCYHCPFASFPRNADFTMGDFMGIGSIKKHDIPLKNGVSALLVNTEKAKTLFEKLINNNVAVIEKAELEEMFSFNYTLWKPSKAPNNRERFWDDFDNYDFSELENRYYFNNTKHKMMSLIKRAVIKFIGPNIVAKLILKKQTADGELNNMPK
ncbi:MAG: Coenzyme F420 hydrogenase/dehydrogenase, beta subunit C-terminal domain [Clostridiales bacterium]|nr:Coenzyme F420 hydrogenase/dehydrogenase, beta subunit C-terminal domain [Clostridiales bacterium]